MIRVSIGSEPMQWLPAQVLKNSIRRRTTETVQFTESWTKIGGWHPLFAKRTRLDGGTKFSQWRWLVPELYDHAGTAVYLDADQVVLADIAELWDALPGGTAIAAVRNAVGIFGKKTPEPNKTQTSVMVLNCQLCDWNYEQLVARANHGAGVFRDQCRQIGNDAKSDYAALMQAAWIPASEIHELDPVWNHFGIANGATKLLHWSHVASQPYRNPTHQTADIFRRELVAAIQDRTISADDVRDEVRAKHLHKSYLSCV